MTDKIRVKEEKEWSFGLNVAFGFGVVSLLLFTLSGEDKLKATAVGSLIAGAASAVGVLTGFLFGIPRTLQREGARPGPAPTSSSNFGVNTNLEQISDWLTKIIVGVGLVQLTTLPGHLMSMGDYLADAFGTPEPVPASVVNLILAYFAIFSFLLGYLWTRIYLAPEFSKVEREALEKPEYLEGMIHALLYQPKPDGFTEAIQKAEDYQQRFGKSNERVWTYLACAYGQQYAYLQGAVPQDQAKLDEAKKNALEAAKAAAQLSKAAKQQLFSQWDKDLATGDEDDLKVFADDPSFVEFFADVTAQKSRTAATPPGT
jgi:hypothetical protein